MLQAHVGSKPVVGMFQASVTTALHMLRPKFKFAVVTTVPGFIEHLNVAVTAMLGSATGESLVFAGTVASGITWDILNKEPTNVAKQLMLDTVRRLVRNGEVRVVCLGGAILHGMGSWVEEACVLELGEDKGREVRIIDPLLPGVVTLNGLVHMLG
jgi:Asp/Glu/hydantoin racemase